MARWNAALRKAEWQWCRLPQVSVVLGDVIDTGESVRRRQPPGRYPV